MVTSLANNLANQRALSIQPVASLRPRVLAILPFCFWRYIKTHALLIFSFLKLNSHQIRLNFKHLCYLNPARGYAMYLEVMSRGMIIY